MICDLTVEDLDLVFNYGNDFFKESYYAGKTELNVEKAKELAKALIEHKNGIALIDRNTGAYFFGRLEEHFFSDFVCAYDYVTYVPIEHRGKGSGYRLLKKFIQVAEEKGANEIIVGDIADIDTETLHKIHKKLGLKYRSKVYSKIVGE